MKDYYVYIVAYGGMLANRWEKVNGEAIIIEGFEELDLFIHHPLGFERNDIWLISEGKTGCSVTGLAISQDEARMFAEEKLKSSGLEAVRVALEKRFSEVGFSPRYAVSGKKS